jgi:hypothetical protein
VVAICDHLGLLCGGELEHEVGRKPAAVSLDLLVRAFVRLRQASTLHADLAKRLDELERTTERLALSHDTFSRNTRMQHKRVFDALRALMIPSDPPKRPIGFAPPEEQGPGLLRRHHARQETEC